MRAAIFRTAGPAAEVLSVEEVDVPAVGRGEVRVRIVVSAVNPTDHKERAGRGPGDFAFKVPDQDGAGVIDAVGEGVDEARVGERVWLFFAAWQRQFGTAAEFCVLASEQAVAMPDAVSFDLGASMGIPALTAHRCLFADGPVDGRTVLVAGGAGAVGHYAIELAKAHGAHVIATVSDSGAKAALAREAGADAVVNYRDEDAAEQVRAAAPGGVDRIVEVDLGHNVALDTAVIARHGAIACYAGGAAASITPGELLASNVVIRMVLVYVIPHLPLRTAIEDVGAALAVGQLSELPATRFGLDDIAAAHDAVEGGAVGKVLVDL